MLIKTYFKPSNLYVVHNYYSIKKKKITLDAFFIRIYFKNHSRRFSHFRSLRCGIYWSVGLKRKRWSIQSKTSYSQKITQAYVRRNAVPDQLNYCSVRFEFQYLQHIETLQNFIIYVWITKARDFQISNFRDLRTTL